MWGTLDIKKQVHVAKCNFKKMVKNYQKDHNCMVCAGIKEFTYHYNYFLKKYFVENILHFTMLKSNVLKDPDKNK